MHLGGELSDETGLADTGLPGHHPDEEVALLRSVPQAAELGQLVFPPDKCAGSASSASGAGTGDGLSGPWTARTSRARSPSSTRLPAPSLRSSDDTCDSTVRSDR